MRRIRLTDFLSSKSPAMNHPGTKYFRQALSGSVKRCAGKAVYLYAFDLAYEMARLPAKELLGHSVAQFSMDASGARLVSSRSGNASQSAVGWSEAHAGADTL